MTQPLELHPVCNSYSTMLDEGYRALIEDIRVNGVKVPIVVSAGQIIDGKHRYRACKELGIECPTIEWNGADVWADARSLNLIRRHMAKDQIYATLLVAAQKHPEIAKPLKEAKEKAVERKANGQKSGGRGKKKTLASCDDQVSKSVSKSSDVIGKELSMSGATVERVERLAREAPELIEKVAKGETTVTKALREVNLRKRREIQQQRIEKPDGKYHCIVVDPPWPIEKIIREERPNQVGFDYPTMSVEELLEWPVVRECAAEDCHLYLWATHKYLPSAFEIARAWGFKYQCLMTWVKNVGFTPFSWMYSTEHVLFCTKGNLELLKMGLRLDFNAKVREHSRKPEEFYRLVTKASTSPRIDVFSRERRDGFEQYGNEMAKFACEEKLV